MIDAVLAALGEKWVVAFVVVFLAALAEGGSKRKAAEPEERTADEEGAEKRSAVLGFFSGLATTLALVFLFVHTLLMPIPSESAIRFVALGAIVFVAAIVGFFGQAIAARSPGFQNLCGMARLPLSAIGLAASGAATVETVPLFLRFIGVITA